MLGTFVIMGVMGLGASFLVPTGEPAPDDAPESGGDWADVAPGYLLADSDADAQTGAETDAALMPATGPVEAGALRDNFDPARDVLEIMPPEGFTGDEMDIAMAYDPEFHETWITVTGDGDSFDVGLSGVTPEEIGPEHLSIAA